MATVAGVWATMTPWVSVEGVPKCSRKVLYTYDAAVEALRWRVNKPGGDGLGLYYCAECGAYHLGHKRTGGK